MIFFADFSKGFDLVDHNALVNELLLLGVYPCIIRWVGSFLTNRKQRVRIGKSVSQPLSPHGGIPQGTRLAPLLFAILVNRLVDSWPYRVKYADDTTVFEIIPRCSPSYLPCIVQDLCSYAVNRGMRLNPKKCYELVINFLHYQLGPPRDIHIMGSMVNKIDSYKLLGV